MRERLVVAFLAVTVTVVAVFLGERVYTTSDLIEAEQRQEVGRTAEVLAALAAELEEAPTAALLRTVLRPGERVEYVGPDGVAVTAATDAAPGSAAGDLVATREIPGGGTVTFARSADVVEEKVADEMLPLVLIALALLALAVLAAVGFARRLSRPFAELADTAVRLGRGDLAVPSRGYGVPEADAVARALRASARDLDALLMRERDFTRNASHALRTPITALRLELEDLVLAPGTPSPVVAGISRAIEQLDRLSVSVAGLLDASRESRIEGAVEIDLAALVRDTVSRWRRLVPRRTILAEADEVVAVRVPAASVMRVLDVLIQNAVTHGEGAVTVRLEECGGYAEVHVGDQGGRVAALAGSREGAAARGGGLATATAVAGSFGGQLRLSEEQTTTFTLAVPVSSSVGARRARAVAG